MDSPATGTVIQGLLQPRECADTAKQGGQELGKGVLGPGVAHEGQILLPQGKVFPKLRKRSPQGSSESASDKEDDEATDYVFRIIYPGTQAEFGECRAGFGGVVGAGTWH